MSASADRSDWFLYNSALVVEELVSTIPSYLRRLLDLITYHGGRALKSQDLDAI